MGFVSYLEDIDKRLDHQLMFISDHIESLRNSGVQTDYLNRIVQLRSELLAFQKTLNKDNLLDILGQLTREQQNRLQLEGNLREEQLKNIGLRNNYEQSRERNIKLEYLVRQFKNEIVVLKEQLQTQNANKNSVSKLKKPQKEINTSKDREIAYYLKIIEQLKMEIAKPKQKKLQSKENTLNSQLPKAATVNTIELVHTSAGIDTITTVFISNALETTDCDEEGWVSLSVFGAYLIELRPDFDFRKLGYKKLSRVVKALPDICELQERPKPGTPIKMLYIRHRRAD